MKLGASLVFAFVIATPQLTSIARADDKHPGREEHHEERHEVRRDERPQAHHEAQRLPPRPAPPTWRGHPPGAHPTSPNFHPAYHPHPVRVLRPHTMRYGEHPWHHWGHGEFVRPAYYWDWALIHSVSCTAEDSYGDQYPVTETTFAGFGLTNMTAVEDDALDRCYEESGGDQGCYLATCSHF